MTSLMTPGAWDQFLEVAWLPDEQIDLARAAFLLSASENSALSVEGQMELLDSLASAASTRLGTERDPLTSVNILSEYLFDELG